MDMTGKRASSVAIQPSWSSFRDMKPKAAPKNSSPITSNVYLSRVLEEVNLY